MHARVHTRLDEIASGVATMAVGYVTNKSTLGLVLLIDMAVLQRKGLHVISIGEGWPL